MATDAVPDYEHVTLPMLLRRRAEEHPDRVFLQEVGGDSQTYGEVLAGTRRWAAGLRGAGVQPGDKVLVMMPASNSSVQIWFALNGIGATEVPVHNDYRGQMLSHLIDVSGARMMTIHPRFLERLTELDRFGNLEKVVVLEEVTDTGLPLEELLAADLLAGAGAGEDEALDGHQYYDVSTIVFTSGTTGLSKGVLNVHAQLHVTSIGAWETLGPDDAYYSVLPPYHVGGKVAVCAMLGVGGRAVFRERFSTAEFWDDIRRYDCNVVALLGAMANFIFRQEPRPDDRDNPADKILMIPLIPEVEAFKERFGVRVRTIFNQTEISSPIATTGYDLFDNKSCGRARPGYDCRVVDDNDEEVPHGGVGELVVRCDRPWRLMAGYYKEPEKTVEAWRNQWLHTGDGFRRDEDGNFYFVDRFKDVIRRRGENISSVEVELIVNQHDDVMESAAIPVTSDVGEEEVKVAVVLKPGRELAEEVLARFCTERMPRFMVPRYIEFVDSLPKTPTEKIRKAELRKLGITEHTWDREAAGARVA
ncbi:MAG: AMP-binding protein [Streptosporangiales bacterium]|nr:AMP-binding protein [Streptosporangiales bacterium]